MTAMEQAITCFPPVLGDKPSVLILGSMPGEKSLLEQQYYAHPRNAFWFIMQELFGIAIDLPYRQRLEGLKANHVALWDVVNSCERKGSLDVAIKNHSIVSNDFIALFTQNPSIELIVFNGAKSEAEFLKRVLPGLPAVTQQIARVRLPSTSPAMASLSREAKLQRWRKKLCSVVCCREDNKRTSASFQSPP